MLNKICQCLNLNPGPLISEATMLSTAPHVSNVWKNLPSLLKGVLLVFKVIATRNLAFIIVLPVNDYTLKIGAQ